MTVESAVPLLHKGYAAGLYFNYAKDEFTLFGYDANKGTTGPIRARLLANSISADLWAAYGLFNRFQVALGLPLVLFQNGQNFTPASVPDATTVQGAGGFALGDPRLYLKARLFGSTRGVQLALSHWLSAPLGNDKRYGGELHYRGFAGEARLLGGFEAEHWRVGLFMGFHWRAHLSTFFSTIIGNELTYGGAAAYDAVPRRLTLIFELYGHSNSIDAVKVGNSLQVNGISNRNDSPLEADLSAKILVGRGFALHLGVGNGIIAGLGSPQPRVFAGVVFAPDLRDSDKDGIPDSVDLCPTEKEDRDGYKDDDGCPDPDNDLDGIPDAQDKCPNQSEDFDGYKDDDGCPDPDNDGDGIPDVSDACPNEPEDKKGPRPADGCPASHTDTDEDGVPDALDKCPNDPEDKDGFEDSDGCPDPDNDGDGIPDDYDQCPNAAEDMDGFEDDDGCPDPDNDKDGVPDALDKCPTEPETINGFKDEDGCPDKGEPKVQLDLKEKRILLHEKIAFEANGAKIRPASYALLDQLAQLLRGHSELKVEIQGHLDDQGDMDKSILLSKQRAEAVRDYLVKKSVEAARLVPAGYGPTMPIADNTAAGREANRRIELKIVEILKPGAKPAPATNSPTPNAKKEP